MSIYFGNDAVNDLYIGLTPVSKGYVGTHLFYNGDSTIIDSTYEKYILNTRFSTLYNTEEAPIKSAILKGNTLVNLLNKLTVNGEVGQTTIWYTTTYTTGTLKSGTYILLYNVKETSGTTARNTPGIGLASGTYLYHGYEDFNTTTGIKKWIFTANEDLSEFGYWLTDNTGKVVVEDFILLEYQEGMENWDIPYFEGMQSVKMPVLTTTGKNIVGNVEMGGIDANGKDNNLTIYARSGFILLKKDTTYTFSLNGVKRSFHLYLYDLNKNFKVKVGMRNEYTPEVDCYIRIFQMDEIDKALYQVEEGTIATPYEPYKSTTVTCNEEVELRGIGEVKDELDLLAGKLTRRIDESGNILSQEITESIDISVVDQDGNEAELSSFEDITHVTVTSEGFLPYVELEVATKNEEVLNTMSLRMDDISTTQANLNETVNTQSENVDATMMATTEIYEQLL